MAAVDENADLFSQAGSDGVPTRQDAGALSPPPGLRDSVRSTREGRSASAIADAMVALVREALGRGPARARAYVHDGVILCVLEETMTPIERTLHAANQDVAVENIRDALHAAMVSKAAGRIEELTGRRVIATLADHHRNPDRGVLVFLTEPD